MQVLSCAELGDEKLTPLLKRYGLRLKVVADETPIPGSFWGDNEAGIIADEVLVRGDTPLHSALHEACHTICMDSQRRQTLHTDAGGDYEEENGVCYLQIVLADYIDGVGRQRLMEDMDRWGYSFRLGSTQAWFEQDAEDARQWLQEHGILNEQGQPTWQMRESRLNMV